jgi:hypothetical protein
MGNEPSCAEEIKLVGGLVLVWCCTEEPSTLWMTSCIQPIDTVSQLTMLCLSLIPRSGRPEAALCHVFHSAMSSTILPGIHIEHLHLLLLWLHYSHCNWLGAAGSSPGGLLTADKLTR